MASPSKGEPEVIFAMSQGDALIFAGVGCYILWVVFMATFRTKDFIDLTKAHEEQKKAKHERAKSWLDWLFKN
jgi:hypothetical protein